MVERGLFELYLHPRVTAAHPRDKCFNRSEACLKCLEAHPTWPGMEILKGQLLWIVNLVAI